MSPHSLLLHSVEGFVTPLHKQVRPSGRFGETGADKSCGDLGDWAIPDAFGI